MSVSQYPSIIPLSRLATVTSTSTWTHPDGASAGNPKPVRVVMYSGGGGAGGGSAYIATSGQSNALGGSGGGAGLYTEFWANVTGSVSVVIGAGGTGGNGAAITSLTATGATGSNGTAGGETSFGSFRVFNTSSFGYGGLADPNAGSTPGTGGVNFGTGNLLSGGVCGSLAGGTTTPTLTSYSFPLYGNQIGAAGGAGGGYAQAIAGTVQSPSNGASSTFSTGGNGGAHSATTNANSTGTAGGNGSGYASGGGGGGGAAINGVATTAKTATGGKGGNGAPGVVFIYY